MNRYRTQSFILFMCGICERMRTRKVNVETHTHTYTMICECEERKFYIKTMYNNTFISAHWRWGRMKRTTVNTHSLCIYTYDFKRKIIILFPQPSILTLPPQRNTFDVYAKHAFHLFLLIMRSFPISSHSHCFSILQTVWVLFLLL